MERTEPVADPGSAADPADPGSAADPADPGPRFEVLRRLGSGATGAVDLVRLLEPFEGLPLGAELARKTLAAAPEHEEGARAAFRAEAEAAAEVRAPSLV